MIYDFWDLRGLGTLMILGKYSKEHSSKPIPEIETEMTKVTLVIQTNYINLLNR